MKRLFRIGPETPDLFSALESSRAAAGPRTLLLGKDPITLDRPLILDARDSGLTVSGSAVLCAGYRLTEWTPEGDFLTAPVPAGITPAAFAVDGRFCSRARFPAEGQLESRDSCDLKWMSSAKGGWDRPPTDTQLRTLHMAPGDIPEGAALEHASVTVYHEWDESTVQIGSFDPVTGEARLASPMEHPAGAFGRNGYVIWGIREGMTAPGQWYFDHARRLLVYWPVSGETMENCMIPAVTAPIRVMGAENVTLTGFTLSLAGGSLERSGLRGCNMPGAVEAENAPGLTLEGITVTHAAGNGVRLTGCPGAVVENCRFLSCGAGGIFTKECLPSVIRNNLVEDAGLLSFSAVGIHAGGKSELVYVQEGRRPESGTALVSGNTVVNCPYCGITAGGGPHIIEHNHLVNCMHTLNDGAAVYVSRGAGTVIRGNFASVTHHTPGLYAWYYDERSAGCVLEDNVAVGFSVPMHFHFCRDITVRRNVSMAESDMTLKDSRSLRIAFLDNIFTAKGSFTLRHTHLDTEPEDDAPYLMGTNIFHSAAGIWLQQNDLRSGGGHIRAAFSEEPLPEEPEFLREDPELTLLPTGEILAPKHSPAGKLGFSFPAGNSKEVPHV